jgi:hypothetical protein
VDEADEADTETVRVGHDDPGLVMLGRLLMVGMGAGALIGGLVVVTIDPALAVDGFWIGAMVGIVAGVAAQVLNAVVLHLARRARPALGRTATRLVLAPVPVAAAVLLAWHVSAGGLAVLVAGALSAATSWAAAPWCLTPMPLPHGATATAGS